MTKTAKAVNSKGLQACPGFASCAAGRGTLSLKYRLFTHGFAAGTCQKRRSDWVFDALAEAAREANRQKPAKYAAFDEV
jgi:hypothetical protein